MTKGNKKHASRMNASNKKNLKQKQSFISRIIPRSREYAARIAVWMVLVIATAGAIPFPHTFSKSVAVPFTTENKNDAELELGDSKVIQEGRNGSKNLEVKSLQSIWARLFDLQPIQQKEKSSKITKKPVNKVVANGTRKYQYMLCSDGSYRHYTDEQFKDADVGFTSKDQDYCAENNQGDKLSLTNTNPADGTLDSNNSPTTNTSSRSKTDTYTADKIDREVAKLNWCTQEESKIGDEYIGKLRQAQAAEGISDKEFNAIVDPAYFKYSGNVGLLRASGCSITNTYPNYKRQY